MSRLGAVIEPNNLRLLFAAANVGRDFARDLKQDLSFARTLLTTLGPFGRDGRPAFDGPVFPPLRRLFVPALAGKRIGLVTSGGSGATASLCGVRRAFEEAGLRVAAISACSGSMLFASLWACGLSAEEMARFWLGLRSRDYIDPDWWGLARSALRRFRGFAGLLQGEALERTYDRLLGGRTLGETGIPLSVVVWNIDRNTAEHLSTRLTPGVSVARAVRVAISIPTMVEPVRLGDAWYGDGGIVDILPVRPLLDQSLDVVFGTNCYLPPGFVGEDIGPWHDQSFSILRASGQLRYAIYLELAREHVCQLGSRLVLLEPVPYDEVRGAKFYETFLDRSAWPRFMRLGYESTRAALERMADQGSAEAIRRSA